MHPAPPTTSIRAQVLLGLVAAIAATATLLAGAIPFAVFVGVLAIAAYYDFRRLLADIGHLATTVIGGVAVAGLVWCGYEGELDLIPAVVAGLVLLLFVVRIVLNEAGLLGIDGVTGDLAATVGA